MINITIPSKDIRVSFQYYLQILNIINPVEDSRLSEGEIQVLTEFALLPEKYSYQRFSRYARKYVLKTLKEQYNWEVTPINLNTKISNILKKGDYLWKDEDGVLYIKPYILTNLNNLISNSPIQINFTSVST